MRLRTLITRSSATVGAAVLMGVALLPSVANATELHNDVGALACSELKVSATQKVQSCADVSWSNSEHTAVFGAADTTAYKLVKSAGSSQWVRDDSVQVSVNSVTLFVDNAQAGGAGLASGPQNGRAASATRGQANLDRSVAHTVYSQATFGVWQNGQQVKSTSVQSNTASIPPA